MLYHGSGSERRGWHQCHEYVESVRRRAQAYLDLKAELEKLLRRRGMKMLLGSGTPLALECGFCVLRWIATLSLCGKGC